MRGVELPTGGERRLRKARRKCCGRAPRARRWISARRQTRARPQPLNSYDGVAITGSALNIYNRDTESLRQIDFVRELFARGIPMFGSRWGLQLAAVAAGCEVKLNPN